MQLPARMLLTTVLSIAWILSITVACALEDGKAAEIVPQCQIKGIEEQYPLASFEQLPRAAQLVLIQKFESWDQKTKVKSTKMAVRGGEWTSSQSSSGSPTRRFLSGGHRKQRWYIFYEHGGFGGRSYHVAIVDVRNENNDASIISHIVIPSMDACDFVQLFIDNPDSIGPGLDDGQYW